MIGSPSRPAVAVIGAGGSDAPSAGSDGGDAEAVEAGGVDADASGAGASGVGASEASGADIGGVGGSDGGDVDVGGVDAGGPSGLGAGESGTANRETVGGPSGFAEPVAPANGSVGGTIGSPSPRRRGRSRPDDAGSTMRCSGRSMGPSPPLERDGGPAIGPAAPGVSGVAPGPAVDPVGSPLTSAPAVAPINGAVRPVAGPDWLGSATDRDTTGGGPTSTPPPSDDLSAADGRLAAGVPGSAGSGPVADSGTPPDGPVPRVGAIASSVSEAPPPVLVSGWLVPPVSGSASRCTGCSWWGALRPGLSAPAASPRVSGVSDVDGVAVSGAMELAITGAESSPPV